MRLEIILNSCRASMNGNMWARLHNAEDFIQKYIIVASVGNSKKKLLLSEVEHGMEWQEKAL